MVSIDPKWDYWFWESYEVVQDEAGQPVTPLIADCEDVTWICGNPSCGLINLGGQSAAEHICAAPNPVVFVAKPIKHAA